MKLVYNIVLWVLFAVRAGTSNAQTREIVNVRSVTKPEATSANHFGAVLNVRELVSGELLVNDGLNRQVTVLDRMLQQRAVIIDSTSHDGQFYGLSGAPLIPYRGDSTVFVDAGASALVLIDPLGKVVGTMALPRAGDFMSVLRGNSGVDEHGNLIYRSTYRESIDREGRTLALPDSAPIVRAKFDTRTVDTIGSYKLTPPAAVTRKRGPDGVFVETWTIHPIPTLDEWAVLSSGAVAIVRGHDYHVDVVLANGRVINGPKLPFDFKRLTDGDKQKIVDSARIAEGKRRSTVNAVLRTNSASVSGGERGDIATPVARPPEIAIEFVPLSQLPDYYPPIRKGAAKADLENRLWILPTTSAQSKSGELIYDVVNDHGELLYRVRMPEGRSIAGFGRGDVVYLMNRDASGWVIERTRIVMGK